MPFHCGFICAMVIICFRIFRTTSESSESCKVKQDLAFVIDASSSICNDGDSSNRSPPPCTNWFNCLQFMHQVVESLSIGPNDTRIACIVFYSRAEVRWKFDTYENKSEVLEAIDNLRYSTGSTYTSLALKLLVEKVFNREAGDRADASDTAIVITDGLPSIKPETTPQEIQKVHDRGIRVLAVGIGEINPKFIKELSSYPQQENVSYFLSNTYGALEGVSRALTNITCQPAKVLEKKVFLENRSFKNQTFENQTFENHTFENHTFENHTFEHHTYENHSFENHTFENHTFENQTFENQTFENHTLENHTFENHTFENHTFENQTFEEQFFHNLSYVLNQRFMNYSSVNQSFWNGTWTGRRRHDGRGSTLLLVITVFTATLLCAAVLFSIAHQLILVIVASQL